MPKLLIKFYVSLYGSGRTGPLFHRWLPDGKNDALSLKVLDNNAHLKVWFERRGFVDNGFIKFNWERRDFDPDIMVKQGVLDAGHLVGMLELNGLTDKQVASLNEYSYEKEHANEDDEEYMQLGKRVVNLIQPPVTKMIDVIRSNYGQYWIPRLEEWDSRQGSLGYYCRQTLETKWSLDEGSTWQNFVPSRLVTPRNVFVLRDVVFEDYLTQKDWNDIGELINEGFEPRTAATLLTRAYQLKERGELKYAFIEGVSALELAIGEYLRHEICRDNSVIIEKMKRFRKMPLSVQMLTVASRFDDVSLKDLELADQAIDLRNKIVHEGMELSEDKEEELKGLFCVVAAMLSGPKFRFFYAYPENIVMSDSEWNERYKKNN